MSADAHAEHGGHNHDDHGHGEEATHFTLKGYVTGFVLSAILTAIPFWLVMNHVLSGATGTALAVLGIGAVQMIVQVIYFLHMDTRSQGGWNMLAFMFTVVIVVITLSGSLWVMYHLNANMMPGPSAMPTSPQDMRNMP